MRMLASREHSREELRRKLGAGCTDAGKVERVLDLLERRGDLSDERFVEAYIRSRKRKGYGPLRIHGGLRERGIDDAQISERLDESDAEWRELLREAARRKFGDAPATDQGEWMKRACFLEYRGFSTAMIRDLLRGCGSQ